jgi:GT2 family glycosyltransferase
MVFSRNKPKISVCIPSWFHPEQHGKYGQHETFWFAIRCLTRLNEAMAENRDDFELIIVDNGSTLTDEHVRASIESGLFAGKDTAETLESYAVDSYFGNADIVIRNPKNLGFASACNQAFALSRGDYVCCLNNDILVWSGCFKALVDLIEMPLSPKPGVSMPALITETGDARKALALGSPSLTRNAGKNGARAEFGSMWLARNDTLKAVAGMRDGYQVFDEKFVNGKEDRLLWMEIRKLNYETYRTHATRVFHQGQMSCGKIKERHQFTEGNAKLLEEYRNKYRQTN